MKKFKELTPIQQSMVRILAEQKGFIDQEIAEVFNISVTSVRTLRGNITRKLNNCKEYIPSLW